MATLSYPDLLKRQNFAVLADRINGFGAFQLTDEKSPPLKATGKVKITQNNKLSFFENNLTAGTLQAFLNSKSGSDSIEVELEDKIFYKVTKFYKDREFGGTASKSGGQGSERQESGLVQALNEAASKYNKAYVISLGRSFYIQSAKKIEGLSPIGKEPYIDISIETTGGRIDVSCKGDTAPSLAGGGVAGIKLVAPDLIKKMYDTIQRHLKNDLKLQEGTVIPAESIPDLYIEIPKKYVEIILKGTKAMGGPVTHMYIGNMDVVSNLETTEVKLNGKFYSISEYMRKIGKFYFRIRKRDLDSSNTTKVVYSKKTAEGYPVLLQNPRNNKNNLRVVIQDKVPNTGKILKLND
jgi:hypothetical protein